MENNKVYVLGRMREIAKLGNKDEQKKQFEKLIKTSEYKEINERAMSFVNSVLSGKRGQENETFEEKKN
ncbi:hypothetical protein BM74_27370 [Bacillus thuringiensis]|uniref:Uncharacterized protein n=1 Tax=Bacillus thuringiensis TaxID=1428 RepID=A0A437SE15_BACTU|nr:hypothetical protein [Bacillus thuringiensis]RVU61198.1 hypothetical protein BM74_27370 [Bacillus thuringiensis]